MSELFIHIIVSVRKLVRVCGLAAMPALLLVAACKEPFMAELKFKETNFLVVEGYISVGPKAVTKIRLSRTVPLSQSLTEPHMETGAAILIEDDQDNIYPLSETGVGIYITDSLDLPVDRAYRLKIATDTEHRYVSDFVRPIITPTIDSVSWKAIPAEGGFYSAVEISVSTHDPQNNTHYYQWNYDEVWERRTPYASTHVYVGGGVIELRDNDEVRAMRRCYERASAPEIITESTRQLQADAITRKLISIPAHNAKIQRKYAVTVIQNALPQDAYNYLQVMKKNSNSLGSFFDPQPSGLYGNMRKVDSSEPVIGLITACQPSIARIMIVRESDVPWWNYEYQCNFFEVRLKPDSLEKYFGSYTNLPLLLDPTPPEPQFITGTNRACADCRIWGGDNNKPDYWGDVTIGGEEEEDDEQP